MITAGSHLQQSDGVTDTFKVVEVSGVSADISLASFKVWKGLNVNAILYRNGTVRSSEIPRPRVHPPGIFPSAANYNERNTRNKSFFLGPQWAPQADGSAFPNRNRDLNAILTYKQKRLSMERCRNMLQVVKYLNLKIHQVII